MCRSFDGLYFAPTKEMEVSHKTVAFASLLLGLIVCKKFMFKFKNERKNTPLLFEFVVLFIPASYKDAMNMLNSPQLNRFTSKRIQVIFSYNCSQSKDGFLGAYAIHFISSIQTPDSDGTVA